MRTTPVALRTACLAAGRAGRIGAMYAAAEQARIAKAHDMPMAFAFAVTQDLRCNLVETLRASLGLNFTRANRGRAALSDLRRIAAIHHVRVYQIPQLR